MTDKITIGIDLGTTYSCVASWVKGEVVIIANDQGNRTTPSVVSFTDDERYIGETAKNLAAQNPKNTISDVKRLMGKKFLDKDVQANLKHMPYKIISGEDDKPLIEVSYLSEIKNFCPEEISAMILIKMKTIAETYFGKPVDNVVITVPAYFGDAQKKATQDAGKIAGLNVIRIINEPTAAAIAYGLDKFSDEKKVLIFDLGGGTLDITVLIMDNSEDGKIFTVKSISGDTHLGGEDFDNNLKDYILYMFGEKKILKLKGLSDDEKLSLTTLYDVKDIREFINLPTDILTSGIKRSELNAKQKTYVDSVLKFKDLISNARCIRKLKTVCETAKKTLSGSSTTNISIDGFYDGEDLNINITKNKFEEICRDDFERCMKPIDIALKDAGYSYRDIDDVVLVGGSTRIPKIREMLDERFPKKLKSDINPDEAVAIGAAIQAAILSDIRDPKIDSLVVIDVTPLSLGIETAGGIMTTMIKKNTSIPCVYEQNYSTYTDNQIGVTIKVFEGERQLTKDNKHLGTFELTGIPSMPKGIPKIKVKFEVDNNGIISITAEETSTGKSSNLIVENKKGRLSGDEIAKMIEDAEKYAENDKKYKEKIESKNEFEIYLSNIKEKINDDIFKLRIGETQYQILIEKINLYSEWIDNCDDDEDDEKIEKITAEKIKEKRNEAENEFISFMKIYTETKAENDKLHKSIAKEKEKTKTKKSKDDE